MFFAVELVLLMIVVWAQDHAATLCTELLEGQNDLLEIERHNGITILVYDFEARGL